MFNKNKMKWGWYECIHHQTIIIQASVTNNNNNNNKIYLKSNIYKSSIYINNSITEGGISLLL